MATSYDIWFEYSGGSTFNIAHTFDDAVKEAARILADQTDQCWSWWAPDAQRVNDYLSLDGKGRINGNYEPERGRIRIIPLTSRTHP